MLKREFASLVNKLKECLNNDPNIVFAFVFGSATTGKLKKDSDVDIAIYFEHPLQGLELLSFINTLSNLVSRDVDVLVLNTASAFLRHQVMKYGAALTIKDEVIYRRFREKTISDYDDYKYVSGIGAYAG